MNPAKSNSQAKATTEQSSKPKTPTESTANKTPAKKKTNGLTASLRIVLLLVFVATVIAGVSYKFYEWKTLKTFAQFHNQAMKDELQAIVEVTELSKELFPDDDDDQKSADQEFDIDEIAAEVDKVKGDLQVIYDRQNTIVSMLDDHQQQYQNYAQNKTKFLLNKKASFIKNLANSQQSFYQAEKEDMNRGLVYFKFMENTLDVGKDAAVLANYMMDTRGLRDDDAVSDYFGDLASLEKYTRDDFKFIAEDEIKELYPYGHEALMKQKQFFKTSYLAVKDLVAGDEESAVYKLSRIGDDVAALEGIDADRIADEGGERDLEIKKQLAESLIKRLELLQQFKQENLGNYPVLEPVNNWETDLAACYFYVYKTDLYREMKDDYPQATDFAALQTELAKISPQADQVSELYKPETINFAQDDKYVKFTCHDSQDQSYHIEFKKEASDDSAAEADEDSTNESE
ncbi:MAG: hypothetical protein GF390_01415 [Candidatus Pacebacteria bacterium]|nr:hypothetical protein [Candidatus Paceibacterota bacterium]